MKKPKSPTTLLQLTNAVRFLIFIIALYLLGYAVMTAALTIRVDTLATVQDELERPLLNPESPIQRPTLYEQISDIRYAIREYTKSIRRLFSEQSRLESIADREYFENGGLLSKPAPHLLAISAQLCADMRARNLLNVQLSDLLSAGSDGTVAESSAGSKTSNSVRIFVIDAGDWLMPLHRMPKPCSGCGAVPHTPMNCTHV